MQLENHLIFKPPFLLFCFLIFIGCAKAQVLIPPKPDGFWYHNRTPNPDSVVIEAFFDPVCPDSRDSWKPLKEAIQNYGSSIALVVHTFPLPYHDNAFLASRALHIVDKLNVSVTYLLLEAFFGQQYGGLRGVYGTPTFFVNGFPLPDAGSALDYNGWLRILDPLVHKQGSH